LQVHRSLVHLGGGKGLPTEAGRPLVCRFTFSDSVEHAEQDHDGFLALSEDGLEVLLGDGQILLGFCASLTKCFELGLDDVGRSALIVEGRSQILQSILHGGGLRGGWPTESTTTTTATTAGTAAAWATATATEEAASAAGVGVALKLHDCLNLRLNGREFIIAGAELLLVEIHHGLRVKAAAAEAASPTAATSSASTTILATAATTVLAAVVLASTILVLAEHRHRQQADEQRR